MKRITTPIDSIGMQCYYFIINYVKGKKQCQIKHMVT